MSQFPQSATAMAVAITALFSGQIVFAEEPEKKLQAVEVVGTSPLPGLGIEKNKLPYDVQTVTSDQINNGHSLNLSEFMSRNLTGVNINEIQGSPFQADITYRGFRLSGILGSPQGLSVYLDGVRVNEPFGDVVNWDMMPEAAISNVTLVPGSNPVYGLNTLGGALAFTTKSGLTAPGTEVKLSLGSWMRKRADVSYGEKSDDGWHKFVAATAFHEDGWRKDSEGQLGNVFVKIGRTQADVNWDLSFLHGRSNLLGNGLLPSYSYDAQGNRTNGMYETNRRWGYTYDDRTKNELSMVNFNLQRFLDGETELATNAYVRYSTRSTVGGDAQSETEGVINQTRTRQTSYGTSINLTKIVQSHQMTTGASLDASRVTYGGYQASGCGFDERFVVGCNNAYEQDVGVNGNSYALGLYASDTYAVTQSTNLTAAARLNHARVNNTLTNYTGSAGTDQPKETFTYNSLNPSFGVSHKLDERADVFGNIGQSNRVPTVIELGCADKDHPCSLPTGLQADPYLKQVIARTLELGTRRKLSDDTGYTVSYYRSENSNDILFIPTNIHHGKGYFSNFSKTRRQGVDLSAYTRISEVDLRISYSYLHATYQAGGDLFGGDRDINIKKGARIAGLPEHTIKLNADWHAATKWLVGGTVIATSSLVTQGNEDGRVAETVSANAKVDGYFLLNLHANYEVTKGLDYFARLNNVFDRRYETYGLMGKSWFDAAGNPSANVGEASRFVAPGAPRSILVGLHYRF